jgi:hypothetical protein
MRHLPQLAQQVVNGTLSNSLRPPSPRRACRKAGADSANQNMYSGDFWFWQEKSLSTADFA